MQDIVSQTPDFKPAAEAGAPDFKGGNNKSVLTRSVSKTPYASAEIASQSDTALATYLAKTVLYGMVKTDGDFYAYTGRQWEPVPYNEMHLIVQALDGQPYTSGKDKTGAAKTKLLVMNEGKIQGILKVLSQRLAAPHFFDRAPTGINCASGFIFFDKAGNPQLEPHSPDHRQCFMMPGIWQGGGDDLVIRDALRVNFRGDADRSRKIDLLGEVAAVGMLGMGGQKSSQCVILLGDEGDNGKSTIIDMMTNGMPPGSSSALPPKKWANDRDLVQLVGKAFNAVAELGGAHVIGSEEFKKAITGDEFTCRDVYRSTMPFRPRAQHLFATNDMPPFAGGIAPPIRKRIVILRCDRVIPLDERDGKVEWLAVNEPDAWLAFLVHGAGRFIRNGHRLTVPPSSEVAMDEWMHHTDAVLSWIEHRVCRVHEVGDKCKSTRAYDDFELFCLAERQMKAKDIPGQKSFLMRVERELNKMRPNIKRSKDNNFRGFIGMRLEPETADMRDAITGRAYRSHAARRPIEAAADED